MVADVKCDWCGCMMMSVLRGRGMGCVDNERCG